MRRDGDQRSDGFMRRHDIHESRARRAQFHPARRSAAPMSQGRRTGEFEMNGETIEQRGRRTFVDVITFIERDDADKRLLLARQVHRAPGRSLPASSAAPMRAAVAPLSRSAMASTSTPPCVCAMRPDFGDRATGAQRRGEIKAAEQTIVCNRERRAAHWRGRREIIAQQSKPGVARWPRRGAKRDAGLQADLWRRARRRSSPARRRHPVARMRRRVHAPNVSSIARSTRTRRADIVQRIAPQAMAEREGRNPPQFGVADRHLALESRERARGAQQSEFAAQAVGAERDA